MDSSPSAVHGAPALAPHGRKGDSGSGTPSTWALRRTALRRTPVSMWDDDVSDWAAALTYYAILALLPALLVTVSLISLVSPATTQALIAEVTDWAPAESGRSLHRALSDMADARSAALTVVIAGAVSAVWSASSYAAVFRRALHAMHGVEDCRPLWRKGHRVVMTALTLLGLLVASALLIVVSGSVAESVGHRIGFGDAGQTAWTVLKWPALLCLVALLVLVLFRNAPPEARGWRHILPGGLLSALLWLLSSGLFTLYATVFGTYGKLYGSLAGVVVFLVWLWVSNLALLAGAQFTVEVEKARGITSPSPGTG
ncbi:MULTISPECIES: YihY/virulence factor BrkB family protein [Streptomyces]|uniref:Ribonuclease BN n=1 Tax=Streptomyces venezuelae TaxID=54571 RepID=A0A5P2BKH1_STRVZ|nr:MULTISPECIES: YihY/virulence factor BrkB family protein [Streptomyces]NEA04043.1 YihY/virulence factor BrkB family protein [Streptomyces sp. SID10116]MYY81290.1 YihY family inner membrane protein [Streptomyces sp. SID335]MYZ18894.1 YihY family inner membrane protein [Streptomyces sp. SID337]NDZ88126.1 YihY/virulence factor BrkB family protein [Streptomyces sp. SID10115]NEB43179.1 YihY/virulence factor BrkB family protein [Streptomyces sp. SID339]